MDIKKNAEYRERLAAVKFQGIPVLRPLDDEILLDCQSTYRRKGYALVRKALSDDIIDFLDKTILFSNAYRNDPLQFYRNHNDKTFDFIIQKILHLMTDFYQVITEDTLLPTYSFAMNYIKGSHMLPHYDNYNNSVSSTVCCKNTGKPNPILIDKAEFQNPYKMRLTVKSAATIPMRNVESLDVDCGDIGIFRGREHLHWRDKITEDVDYRAVLLHYTDYTYKGKALPAYEISYGDTHPFADAIGGINMELTNFDDYDSFREKYVMYFSPKSVY